MTPGNFVLMYANKDNSLIQISMYIICTFYLRLLDGVAEVLKHFQLTKTLALVILCIYAELVFGKLQNGWPRYEIKCALDVRLQSYFRQT